MKTIEKAQELPHKISNHDIHHYAINYLILVIIVAALLYKFKKFNKGKQPPSAKTTTADPRETPDLPRINRPNLEAGICLRT